MERTTATLGLSDDRQRSIDNGPGTWINKSRERERERERESFLLVGVYVCDYFTSRCKQMKT